MCGEHCNHSKNESCYERAPSRTRKIGLSHGNFAGTRERFACICAATDRNSAAGRAGDITNADRRRPGIELRAGTPSLAGSALRGASPWRALGDGWLPCNLALRIDRHRNLCSLITTTRTTLRARPNQERWSSGTVQNLNETWRGGPATR